MSPDVAIVLDKVASLTGVPVEVIIGPKKTNRACHARFLAYAALRRRYPWWSKGDIAAATGRMDPATIIHGLRRAARLAEEDREFAAMLGDAAPSEPGPQSEVDGDERCRECSDVLCLSLEKETGICALCRVAGTGSRKERSGSGNAGRETTAQGGHPPEIDG